MILSYTFPQFEQKILDGEKIHTFRLDPHCRWRTGLSIQHWMGSPRNPKSNPRQFLVNECTGVQTAVIVRVQGKSILRYSNARCGPYTCTVEELLILINGREYIDEETMPIIDADGLTQAEFYDFFVPKPKMWWQGRIIHWTPNLY